MTAEAEVALWEKPASTRIIVTVTSTALVAAAVYVFFVGRLRGSANATAAAIASGVFVAAYRVLYVLGVPVFRPRQAPTATRSRVAVALTWVLSVYLAAFSVWILLTYNRNG